jgi:hypothetical protein
MSEDAMTFAGQSLAAFATRDAADQNSRENIDGRQQARSKMQVKQNEESNNMRAHPEGSNACLSG